MNILFNNGELLHMLTNLYALTGIRANIFDFSGKDICLSGDHAPFCERINAVPEGHTRCINCDAQAVKRCAGRESAYFYRCHAGLQEAVIPIDSSGMSIAYLAFGQLLDDSPMEAQWQRARAGLLWYPEGPDALKADFFRLRQYSKAELTAFAEVLKALASYIHLSGLIQAAEYNDLQRLEIYIDQHYTQPISLGSACEALGVSRSKLCAMAKQLSGGKTFSHMIATRRVSQAKRLLLQSDAPISAIAESVGIGDYNYFTKVFRSIAGMTPSAFRKARRQNPESVSP